MNWYVINTKSHGEKLAEMNIQRLGVETLCPRIKQNKMIRRKRLMVEGPLFPGYLFARFDLEPLYRAVNYAWGVRKIVSFGNTPISVDDEMIDSIKSRLQEGFITVQAPRFTPGQVVQIQQGPLQGFEAIFEREMSDRQRVVLLLQVLTKQTRVVVDVDQVVGG